jgi:hypothetical protein
MGNFDQIFQELPQLVIALFVDTPATLIRTKRNYDEVTGRTVVTTEGTVELLVSPPQAFDIRMIDGKNILSQDMFVYAPAKAVVDAGVEILPSTDAQLTLTVRTRVWRIERAEILSSGDGDAVYILQLRP